MEKLTSLHFPETIAQYPDFRQLLLFVDSIIQYLPAEDSLSNDEPLVAAELLDQQVPLPFGDELSKFQHLIKDIQGHGNEYYGNYLASLSSSAPIDVDEASVWQLINQMSNKETNLDKNLISDNQQETLLQARLLLKLAEINSKDEKELDDKMSEINSQKEKLMAALKGEGDAPVFFKSTGKEHEIENPKRTKQRLKAWTYLLLNNKQADSWLLTTGSNEILELLNECCGATAATRIFDINLGELSSNEIDNQTYLAERKKFQERTKSIREIFYNYLMETAATGNIKEKASLQENIAGWNEVVKKYTKPNFAKLEFYLFRTQTSQLFGQICNISVTNPSKKQSMPNTIVGVLT